MEKCRLCLGNKKNLRSIYEIYHGFSYAFKITSITNIKIMKEDGITDQICLGCRKKLDEVFEFKLMIERSDAALQSSTSCKTIRFDNLQDIKLHIEINDKHNIPKCENNIDKYFKYDELPIFYKNITIKRKEQENNVTIKKESGPLSVIDFLNHIKEDTENDYDDNFYADDNYEPNANDDDDEDEEFLLPLSIRKKQAKANAKKKQKNSASEKERKNYNYRGKLNKIMKPIKPVYMSDVRVLPCKTTKEKPKIKNKYKYTKREMCNYCGKLTVSLKHHLLTHTGERSFKCEECGKGFLTSASLNTHKKTHVHPSQKTIKCGACVATFATQEALRSHMISHSDEKKHVCDVCSKPFKRKAAMNRHRLMHNVTNKNVKCEQCNMSFFTKYGLNHHMRVHTGERPYNCEICSQPYSYKHDFNRHCLKKHGVFLKRRSVNVMNEEVLKRERALMRDLMLKAQGFINDDENMNPFDGPQGPQAFEMAMKALKAKQIPIDFYI